MRRIILLTICLIGLYARSDVLQVGVTIPPQKEPVLAVMGTNVQVRILMEGNQNPHFFRPSAKRLSEIAACNLYFTIGFPGEENVEKKFSSIGKPRLVSMLEEGQEHHHGEADHDHHVCGAGIDTHYWTSPSKLKEFAHVVYEQACELMPSETEYFKQNLETYEQRCDKVLAEGKAAIKAADVEYVLTYHPALGNYASAMGITQLTIEKDGRAPTLGVVARVVTEARKHGIKKIFVQNSGEASQSKVILDRLDATAIEIHILTETPRALIEEITSVLTKK